MLENIIFEMKYNTTEFQIIFMTHTIVRILSLDVCYSTSRKAYVLILGCVLCAAVNPVGLDHMITCVQKCTNRPNTVQIRYKVLLAAPAAGLGLLFQMASKLLLLLRAHLVPIFNNLVTTITTATTTTVVRTH